MKSRSQNVLIVKFFYLVLNSVFIVLTIESGSNRIFGCVLVFCFPYQNQVSHKNHRTELSDILLKPFKS